MEPLFVLILCTVYFLVIAGIPVYILMKIIEKPLKKYFGFEESKELNRED